MASYQGRSLPLADSDVESEEEYGKDENDKEETPEEKRMSSFVNAIKHGFVKTARELLEEGDIEDLVQGRDKEGHTPLHWAALGGYNSICELLLEKGCPINEHSDNDYGPRPIHWACVHGHVVTVDFFLERGVHIDTSDLNGCSPLLIASQYGQSLVLSYLLQKGANKFHVDINGDTALHWGAFKGYPEIVFLLLNAGLDPKQKDSFGQSPMHSACIKGDVQVAEMLLEHGSPTDEVDSNGKTPRMLAEKRRHRRLLQLLDGQDIPTQLWDWKTWVFGPPTRTRVPIMFFMSAILFWGYPIYYFKAVPFTLEQVPTLHHVFWVGNVLLWIFFIWLKFSNPGFIKPDRDSFDKAQKMIGDPTAWGEYNDLHNPVYNMCHTCKTVRPVRSKHCRQCDKCVDHFDHHCPWIDNCVGIKNRVPFFFFVHIMLFNGFLIYLMMYHLLKAGGGSFLVYAGIVGLVLFSFPVLVMLGYVWMLMLLNMTTNERANYKRYRHFRDVHGQYHNPFNRGIFMNIMEYFNLVEPRHRRKGSSSSFVA